MNTIEVGIKVYNDKYLPRYAHEGDAGMDLVARLEGVEIALPPETSSRIIPTGVWLELPAGYEAQIRSRSGLAANKNVSVLNSPGTIDSNYRGEIGVILFNHGTYTVRIEDGMRIAQMVVMPVPKVVWKQVDNLTATERGDHGFGSTGTKTT